MDKILKRILVVILSLMITLGSMPASLVYAEDGPAYDTQTITERIQEQSTDTEFQPVSGDTVGAPESPADDAEGLISEPAENDELNDVETTTDVSDGSVQEPVENSDQVMDDSAEPESDLEESTEPDVDPSEETALEAAEETSLALNRFSSVDEIINHMTLRQKITQCLMLDFRLWNDNDGQARDMTVLPREVEDIIGDYQFGSIILFANNIKTTEATVALTRDLQQASLAKGGLPLLIATDQEGGTVYRLGSGTALPGNMALAATGNPDNARIAGEIIGSELNAVGINTTLAPVIDVNNNPNNTVIGLRAFSDDPDMVGEYGSQFISGLNNYNIIGCAKHFPGHGDTATDSHYGLPVVDKSLEELMDTELVPYKTAIAEGIDMIMTAHILYPQIDSSRILSDKTGEEESRPATMSEKILNDVLREDLGFRGVVVTDAMNMAGIANNFTSEQSTLEAIKAGADMVCMPVTGVYDKDEFRTAMDRIIAYIKDAVEAGDLPEDRLNKAVTRILTLKQSKGILDYNADDYTESKAKATVGSDENRELERKIAAEAVTLIRNENNVLPYKAEEGAKVLMLCPYNNERAQMVMGLNRARAEGKVPQSVTADIYRYSADDFDLSTPEYSIIADGTLREKIDWADLVIINSEVSTLATMSPTHWLSFAPDLITKYCRQSGKTSVVMSVNKPYDIQLYPDADAILAVYGCKGSTVDVTTALLDGDVVADENACGPNITAGVEVLFGNFQATGKLPLDVPVFSSADGAFTEEIAYKRGYGLTYQDGDSDSGQTGGSDSSQQGGNDPDQSSQTDSGSNDSGNSGQSGSNNSDQVKEAAPGKIKSISLSKTKLVYTGKAIKPAVTVKDSNGKKVAASYYTVKYSSNTKVGTARVAVTGKGKYTGTVTRTFKIVPKKAVIRKVARGRRSVKVTMTSKASSKGASKYQVAYRYKGSSKWKYKTTSARTFKISKLKKGKIYKVRVRAYSKIKGKTYYGAWSKTVKSGRIR